VRHLGAGALVALMAIGSVVMWLVSPVAWLWIASQIVGEQGPSGTGYLLVLAGVIVTFVVLGRWLSALNRAHMALTRRETAERVQAPWLRSMRGEREVRRDGGVLDRVMITSVAIALAAMGAWFLLLAGSPLPSA
jgi:hypothetical protein